MWNNLWKYTLYKKDQTAAFDHFILRINVSIIVFTEIIVSSTLRVES